MPDNDELTRASVLTGAQQAEVRRIAREELASMAGLVLRRSQEPHFTRSIERNTAQDVVNETLSSIFGEALADFSGQTTGGQEPGEE